MTLPQNCQFINQKINQLRTLLIEKLNDSYVDTDGTESFTELVELVGTVEAIEVLNDNNVRPPQIPEIDNNNISNFYMTLYNRIRYYMRLLGYFLVLKGVPRYEVNAQTDLKGLIELIDNIEVIKPSILTLAQVDETQYYGTNIVVNYTLQDPDGVNIREGDITIQDSNGITYDSVIAGQAIAITPLSVSPKVNGEYQSETFIITYNGSDKYLPSEPQTFSVKILPAKINLIVKMTNINTNSRYFNSNNTAYETDEWEISVKTLNYQNQPIPDMPFTISIPNVFSYDEVTNANGEYVFSQVIEEIGNHILTCTTTHEDIEKITNASITHDISIKYNILAQTTDTYTDYTGKNNYTYSLDIIDEDDGNADHQYDGRTIKVFLDNVQIGTSTITNAKASYTFTSLNVGEKTLRWVFEEGSFNATAITYLNILSNFILPASNSFFSNDTPEIIYAPEGVIESNTTINGSIKYTTVTYEDTITGYNQEEVFIGYETTIVPVLVGYETFYNEITGEDEFVLDENNEKIPIYENEEIEVLDNDGNPIPIYETQNTTPIIITTEHYNTIEEDITCTTNSNGLLDTINTYVDIGEYELTLYSSNGLNETCIFNYTIKKPFDIELINYNKKEQAIYRVTLYDTDDSYDIILKNNNNTLSSSFYTVNSISGETYPTIEISILSSNDTIGQNQLIFSLNGYSETMNFNFIAQIFSLLTSSVSLGLDTMHIQCNDDTVSSIEVSSEYINISNIDKDNNIFVIDGEFTKAGSISFNVIDDTLSSESLTITVNKEDLSSYTNLGISTLNAQDNRTSDTDIVYSDRDNIDIIFNIDRLLYSDLSLNYVIKQSNTQVHNQSFTYYKEDENNFILTIPSLAANTYTMNIIFSGDTNYLPFVKTLEFTILKANPTIVIDDQYSGYDTIEYGNLTITHIQNNQDIIITALFLDDLGDPISNANVIFWYNDTQIDTKITDNNGQATTTYTLIDEEGNFRASTNHCVSNMLSFGNRYTKQEINDLLLNYADINHTHSDLESGIADLRERI